jgi:hypothetical protein
MGWAQSGAAEATPWPLGVVQPPPSPKLKKKLFAIESGQASPKLAEEVQPPLMGWSATVGFLKYFLIFYF